MSHKRKTIDGGGAAATDETTVLAYLHANWTDEELRRDTDGERTLQRTFTYEIELLGRPEREQVHTNSMCYDPSAHRPWRECEAAGRAFWRQALQQMYADGWRRAPAYDAPKDDGADIAPVPAFVK